MTVGIVASSVPLSFLATVVEATNFVIVSRVVVATVDETVEDGVSVVDEVVVDTVVAVEAEVDFSVGRK